jgi:hypothetical protein
MKPFWKKIWVVGFVFEFCIWGLNAQQLLNPTLSSFSLETNVGNKMISCTSGETMTGLKNGNLHFVIEGIYVFKDAPDVGTSLMPLSDLLWRVFPNPAKGKFTISNEANKNEIKADIFHLSGIQVKTLMVSAFSSVNVSDLKEGIYLIKIDDFSATGTTTTYVKLIIIQ